MLITCQHIENKIIGTLTQTVIDEFNLNLKEGQPIFIGESNLNHMKSEHPEDFEKYGDKISEIINSPDYIAKHHNKKNSAIEYIKAYKKEHIKITNSYSGKICLIIPASSLVKIGWDKKNLAPAAIFFCIRLISTSIFKRL